MTASASAVTGSYYFAVTFGSATSAVAALNVGPSTTPGATLGAQMGTLYANPDAIAMFAVTTTNIADGTPGTVSWYTDSSGKTAKSAPAGVTATVPNITNNASTMTIKAATSTVAGSYYFAVTFGSTNSSVATLTVSTGILASGLDSPKGIVVDSTNVYWAEATTGTIKRVARGGGTVATLANGLSYPWGIAVDSTNVYWTDQLAGTVNKVVLSGGTPTILASGQNWPEGIALDSANVYWVEYWPYGKVRKVALSGGAVVTLASGLGAPRGIAVDSTNVYWTEDAGGMLNCGIVRTTTK